MATKATKEKYTATIGIECHVQLKTVTKLFAAVGNDARDAQPNTLISHICLGMPGALPVLNAGAVLLAIRAALALNTLPEKISKFDRKHYFYPDLPMGYQITQFYEPIIRSGSVAFAVGGKQMKVRIHEAHLEADAAKSTHLAGKEYSLVDFNRAGTPLLEIVSEPDMHTSAEAKAYAQELWMLMRYADVSDANLYYGNMRFDVNVSVSKDPAILGTRTETKNLNSFRSVERAVDFEINRQIDLLEKDQIIVQETLGWDDSKQRTFSQRSKEEAHDYRYMPDPDLPPIVLDEQNINNAKESMPIMPGEWRAILHNLGVDNQSVETLLVAEISDDQVSYLPLINQYLENAETAKTLINWFINVEIPMRSENNDITTIPDKNRKTIYDSVYKLLIADKLSSTGAKSLLVQLLTAEDVPESIERYANEHGFIQESNLDALAELVTQVLAAHPQAVEDIKNGETKAIGFLTGQVMKASMGKANPQIVQQIIQQQLAL